MKTTKEIEEILSLLDEKIADQLESQVLDFKEWNERSFNDSLTLAVKMAVCMANGGDGSVVFGVADKVRGRSLAIKGISKDIDFMSIQKRIYEKTDPHITVVLEELRVPEGTGRLLIMHVYPGMPPYTTSDGSATIRQGKDCMPFTGTFRRQTLAITGQSDFTSELVYEDWRTILSASAMERVRELMAAERAVDELKRMSDEELLNSIGAKKGDHLTKGAILLIGKPDSIERIIPEHRWSFRKMLSDTDYSYRDDGTQAIPVALYELERYISVDNPTVTVESGLAHPEFSTYPKIALREALLNAFGHRDFRMPGTVMLKSYKEKLILTNPGEFIGGVTISNILHHPPVTRNHHLMDLLDKLKLVNRSNLGVSRIYRSLLIEGKEPPVYREVGNHIELTFFASTLKQGFIRLVSVLQQSNDIVDVDQLLILQYLLKHKTINNDEATFITQRSPEYTRELLSKLSNELLMLESVGRGRGRYFTLSRKAYEIMKVDMGYERQQQLDDETMKLRILSILKSRNLANREIRQLTGMSDKQVQRFMKSLSPAGVTITGHGVGAKYVLMNKDE